MDTISRLLAGGAFSRQQAAALRLLLGEATASAESIDDRVAALLAAGANITLTYNDVANTLTIASSGGGVSDGDKGDVTVTASGVTWTIDAGAITLAKQANLAASSIIGNNTGAAATPIALTAAQVRTLINVADGATANATDASLRDRTTHTGTQAVGTITGLAAVATSGLKADVGLPNVDNTSDLAKPISTAQAAVNAAKADLVGGKVPTAQLPSITIGETFSVASQAAMVALTAQIGDVAIRTDLANRKYLLLGTAATAADWVAMDASGLPVDSVNGFEGVVVLGKADVGLPNVDNTSDPTKPVSTATQTALNLKLNSSAVSVYGLTLVDDADAATARTTLGLGTAATAAQADLLGRANHTGTQAAATVSDFSAAADARIGAAVINALADVIITTPATGQALKYDGTNWTNQADATGSGAATITAVTATIPFGASEQAVTITDAAVTPASKIIIGWGSARDTDENGPDMDDVTFWAVPTDGTGGSFSLKITSADYHMIGGSFKLNYMIG